MNVAATPVIFPMVISGVPDSPVAVPVRLPTNPPAAVTIPDVLILTVVPIPTDFSSPLSSVNCISPVSDFLIVIAVVPDPISISSIPLFFFSLGFRVIYPVPIVNIPVTLASPLTTRSSVKNPVSTPT